MATGNSVADEIREQRGKLKGKTLKEKWLYFWEYYRVPALITVLVIVFAGSIIYSIATQKDIVFYGMFINGFTTEDQAVIMEEFTQYAGIDTNEFAATLDPNFVIEENPSDQYSMANLQKIMAMVASQEVDGATADEATFTSYAANGYFADLTEVLPADLLSQYEDKLFYCDLTDDEKGEVPVGIYMTGAAKLEELGAYGDLDQVIYGIFTNTKRADMAVKFFEFLEGQP